MPKNINAFLRKLTYKSVVSTGIFLGMPSKSPSFPLQSTIFLKLGDPMFPCCRQVHFSGQEKLAEGTATRTSQNNDDPSAMFVWVNRGVNNHMQITALSKQPQSVDGIFMNFPRQWEVLEYSESEKNLPRAMTKSTQNKISPVTGRREKIYKYSNKIDAWTCHRAQTIWRDSIYQ